MVSIINYLFSKRNIKKITNQAGGVVILKIKIIAHCTFYIYTPKKGHYLVPLQL